MSRRAKCCSKWCHTSRQYQADTDSLAKQEERINAMATFEKFEAALPSMTKQYEKLEREANEYSLIPQTEQQLGRVKTEEQLLSQDLDKQYGDRRQNTNRP